MSYQIDLEEREIQSLEDAADWEDRDVLEIGDGEGRLACVWQFGIIP